MAIRVVMLKECVHGGKKNSHSLPRSISAPIGSLWSTNSNSNSSSKSSNRSNNSSKDKQGKSACHRKTESYEYDPVLSSLLEENILSGWDHSNNNITDTIYLKPHPHHSPSYQLLQVKKSHRTRKVSKNHYTREPEDRKACRFIHYTDTRQYVEDYRQHKIFKMQERYASSCNAEIQHQQIHEQQQQELMQEQQNISEHQHHHYEDNVPTRSPYPLKYLHSYGNIQNKNFDTSGYRVDDQQHHQDSSSQDNAGNNTHANNHHENSRRGKGYLKGTSLEKERGPLSKVRLRGVKCLEEQIGDVTKCLRNLPVSSCKPISICNLFPYESISLPDNRGHVMKSKEPLQPEVSLQCTKINEQSPFKNKSKSNSRVSSGVTGTKLYPSSVEENCSSHTEESIKGPGDEYSNIIKRVLRHYERTPVRTTQTAEPNFTYILTPS